MAATHQDWSIGNGFPRLLNKSSIDFATLKCSYSQGRSANPKNDCKVDGDLGENDADLENYPTAAHQPHR